MTAVTTSAATEAATESPTAATVPACRFKPTSWPAPCGKPAVVLLDEGYGERRLCGEHVQMHLDAFRYDAERGTVAVLTLRTIAAAVNP